MQAQAKLVLECVLTHFGCWAALADVRLAPGSGQPLDIGARPGSGHT